MLSTSGRLPLKYEHSVSNWCLMEDLVQWSQTRFNALLNKRSRMLHQCSLNSFTPQGWDVALNSLQVTLAFWIGLRITMFTLLRRILLTDVSSNWHRNWQALASRKWAQNTIAGRSSLDPIYPMSLCWSKSKFMPTLVKSGYDHACTWAWASSSSNLWKVGMSMPALVEHGQVHGHTCEEWVWACLHLWSIDKFLPALMKKGYE